MTKSIIIEEDLLPLIGSKQQVLDGITGYVEHYDFSQANSSYEARVQAVTKVASICYQSPKALGSISLFNRLQAESAGLPSSSYEFVPVLLADTGEENTNSLTDVFNTACGGVVHDYEDLHVLKYGEKLAIHSKHYLLTNLRALIEDVGPEESLNYLNTSEEEQQIIKDNFKVFLFNIDVPTRTQMIRHRVSWQELSRRYVSGKKSPFDFYVSKKMKDLASDFYPITSLFSGEDWAYDDYEEQGFSTEWLIDACLLHYDTAIANGVKPEEARRILPQAMMTTIWGAFQPNQLDSFFKLRLDKHAQKEVRMVAEAMKKVLDED